MDKELLDSIEKMIPEGNLLKLPKEQIANYPAVKKCLINAGGKYKSCAFVFPDDASVVQSRLLGGEAINDNKKFQFFPTPESLALRMVEKAGIKSGDDVLEPSAGQGAILEAIQRVVGVGDYIVDAVELMDQNVKVLGKMVRKCRQVFHMDFLDFTGTYDKIIANPPFTKNQDIDHIKHMYEILGKGGRIVTLASTSWVYGSQKKQKAFREWLDNVGAIVEEIPAGEFKGAGTMVATTLITINK